MYALAAFGVLVGLGVVAVIVYDVWCVNTGRETVSRRTLTLSRRYPIIAGLVGAIVGFVIGCLAGHLWFPQYVYLN